MGTTEEKLDYLEQTKKLIAAAIEEQGVNVSDEDTFRAYAALIATIGKLPDLTEEDEGKILRVIGGVWGIGVGLSTDATLKTAGAAADAKVTGDRLTALEKGASTGEIPTFDLVALGLSEVSTGGGGRLLQTDTTAMRDALDRGVVKFVISTTMFGTTEFVVGKCSVLDSGLYLCYYPMSNAILSVMIADGSLQVSVIPDIHLPDVKAEDNGKVLQVVNGAWAAAELSRYLGEHEEVE